MDPLAWRLADFDGRLYRSVVTIRPSETLWDDLTDDPDTGAVMDAAIAATKPAVAPPNLINAPFAYYDKMLAVGNPPAAQIATRYSDGSFPAWYGSTRPAVSVAETLYWFVQGALADHTSDYGEPVIQHRQVGSVHCRALLIDLRGQRDRVPALTDPHDHRFCRCLGQRLQSEGHPGLLAPSARATGDNGAIFTRRVLDSARTHFHTEYVLDPATWRARVMRRRKTVADVAVSALAAGERLSEAQLNRIE